MIYLQISPNLYQLLEQPAKKTINFITGGLLGDFIHSLFAVKHICEQKNAKADIYISNKGDTWKFGLKKAYNDLKELVLLQPYVNSFQVLTEDIKEHYNMCAWRNERPGRCWTDLLSGVYRFTPTETAWLTIKEDRFLENLVGNKILIHRSPIRHNPLFDWNKIIKGNEPKIMCLATNRDEWNYYQQTHGCIGLVLLENILQVATAIHYAAKFIGNQSAPFAIACALDKERLCELYKHDAHSYMGEEKYSSKISWYLNDDNSFSRGK